MSIFVPPPYPLCLNQPNLTIQPIAYGDRPLIVTPAPLPIRAMQ